MIDISMLSREETTRLQRTYGLSYHLAYAAQAQSLVGFAGKTVVEVGGSLPEGFVFDVLGAQSWTAVEELGYWNEIAQQRPLLDARPIEQAGEPGSRARYSVLTGRIEDAPPSLDGRFDVAFSIAAFEHMDRLPTALDAVYRVLKPGGTLFSMFSPVWSATNGHHLPDLFDAQGKQFDVKHIPEWGHLLYSPPEMFAHICKYTDRKTAANVVYYIYNSPHINRLFIEDYVSYIQQSSFIVEKLNATFPQPISPETQQALQTRWPGKTMFSPVGLMMVLRRGA